VTGASAPPQASSQRRQRSPLRGAAAGALAAGVWAAQQPLDKRLFRSEYDDLALLGKAVTRGPGWLPAGVAIHLANGAVFGALYTALLSRLSQPGGLARGVFAAQVEHWALWPLGRVTDRFHPARRELPQLAGNRRAMLQGAWRHLLFGAVLGAVEERLNT
jgi:hypothetical protein